MTADPTAPQGTPDRGEELDLQALQEAYRWSQGETVLAGPGTAMVLDAFPKLLRRCARAEAAEAELERLRGDLRKAQREAEETRADFRDATGVGYPEFREKRGTFGRDYAKAWLRGDPNAARLARRLPPVKPQPQEASEGQEGDLG